MANALEESTAVEPISRRRVLAGVGAAGVMGGIAGLLPSLSRPQAAIAAGCDDGVVSVKDFGAIGDGKADDSSAIQEAIDAAASSGRAVLVPGGVFLIGTPLVMKSSLTLRGTNRGKSILRLAPSSNGPLLDAPTTAGVYQTVDDLTLSDLTLDGDAAHSTVSEGTGSLPLIRSYQSRRWHLARCSVINGRGYGLALLGDPRSASAGKQGPHEDTYLLDCQFLSNGMVKGGDGFVVKSAERLTMEHCTAATNKGAGFNIRAQFAALVGCNVLNSTGIGFILDSTTNAAESTDDDAYISLLGGSAEGCTGAGVAILRNANQSIDKGVTHACIAGFNSRKNGRGLGTSSPNAPFTDTAISLAIHGGQYVANKDQGISVNGARHLTIQGAICRSNASDGIQISDTAQGTVVGCQIRENNGWGIYLGGEAGTLDRMTTVANVLKGNATGALRHAGANSKSSANATDQSAVVASAATLTLPSCEDSVLVTGSTNITAVTSSFNGRIITLRFEKSLSVVKGSNLKLAANFAATAADTLTLACHSGTWYELSRSANN